MDEHPQLCRICISNFDSPTMIPIFGEDLLWEKITTLANVKIEKGDTLPQQVCIVCAKAAITACLFKKKCEDADNFFRNQFQMKKVEFKSDVITISEGESDNEHSQNEDDHEKMTEDDGDGDNDDDDDDDDECDGSNNKRAFDINSIRLMNEFMQQQHQHYQMVKDANNFHTINSNHSDMTIDDEQLPLIPEIELITPQGDVNTMQNTGELRDYQCNICYQNFEMRQLLKLHMLSVHGTSGPIYECSNCKKTYFYKRFLEKHIRRGRCVQKRRNHTRPMQCTDCHVLFPTGHHLGWHKRTGCPSRTSKVPLQQLFKQNIVQYNNFPKKVVTRKPENAFYTTHNRKIFMNNTKRKGRTRIKLDAKKIALAKQLILKEATTTQIATELNISRTFAWRLRKNLVNGVSVHERVIDQAAIADDQNQNQLMTMSLKNDQIEENDKKQQHANNTEVDSDTKTDNIETNKNIDSYNEPNTIANQQETLNIPNNMNEIGLKFHDEESSDDDYEDYETKKQDCEQPISYINQTVSAPQSFCSPTHKQILYNQLPVNLSIKPITSLQNVAEVNESQLKKPRKPNVFIDEEKYEMAKGLVVANASTMEIARQLNVSQMTAWKLRDAIVKGVPLSYRSKRESRQKNDIEEQHQQTFTTTKPIIHRRRLKAAERVMRDKEITKEILEMIKEDSNIQYWKVSARLAEKGFPISPSSVCQKLKALGIHRRWKPGDKPPMLDVENIKTGLVVAAGVAAPAPATTTTAGDVENFGLSSDQQFEMGGAHFLSAFTR